MPEKIIEQNLADKYKEDASRYMLYVNYVRMMPDIRDGLKKVHRRILYSMSDNNQYTHKTKTASVVGDVMGKYHPHGDAAIADTIQPMTNDFQIKVPLLIGQGNWGSISGAGAAHMRYTETMLSPYSMDCLLSDMRATPQVVEWDKNYDRTLMEPAYLAAAVPNLLINGSFGIGFGLKSEIPKHNLIEVIDAEIKLIKDPSASIILIPDQCQKVDVIGADWKKICNTGYGHYYARGHVDIEGDTLIIRSLPDMVFLDSVVSGMEDLVKAGMIHVASFNNMTDTKTEARTGYKLEAHINLKKGSDPYYARNLLYKKTELEKRCVINMEVLDGINLIRMSYKQYLLFMIEFRKMVKFIQYNSLYQQVMTKIHEREAYINLAKHPKFDDIKLYVHKKYDGSNDAEIVEALIKKYSLTDMQAAFIINLKMKNMSKAMIAVYEAELNEWKLKAESYITKMLDDNLILAEIVEELEGFKKKFGKPRKCNIIEASGLSDVPKGDFKVVITEGNFIKKMPLNFEHNASKGRIISLVKGCNTQAILIFDEFGRSYRLPIDKIPMGDKSAKGQDIRTLIKSLTCDIVTVIYEPTLVDLSKSLEKYFMVVLTESGNIKKMDLEDFLNVPPSGIKFINIDDDRVAACKMVHSALDIVLYSDHKALRMNMSEVPHQKRNTKGLRAMNSDEKLDGMSIIHPESTDVVVITEKGFVNRFDIVALPKLSRYQTGSSVIKLAKGDRIRSIMNFKDTGTEVIRVALSGNNEFLVKVSDIEKVSSISPGKRTITMGNEHIITAGVVMK